MKKIALLSLSALFLAGCSVSTGGISTDEAQKISAEFITLLAPGTELNVTSVEKFAGGDFKITIDASGQEVISFLSPDGTTFYPQGLDIADIKEKAAEFAALEATAVQAESASEAEVELEVAAESEVELEATEAVEEVAEEVAEEGVVIEE